jgi:hypothetical protein
MIKVYDNFTNGFLFPNALNLFIFTENHDAKRLNQFYSYNEKNTQNCSSWSQRL